MPGPLSKRVGKRIRELRDARGQSLEQFAKANGLSRTSVWETEAGRMSPTVDYLQRIADALGVHITDLFPEESTAAQGPQARGSRKTRAQAPA